jgi:hypothetical protein
MANPTPSSSSSPSPSENLPSVRVRLKELAGLLRQSGHLKPQVQGELADLLEEMADELQTAGTSSHSTHLAESTAHLAEQLHRRKDVGLLGAAKERLDEAAARAEAKAPVATGLARRLIDVLSEIGI